MLNPKIAATLAVGTCLLLTPSCGPNDESSSPAANDMSEASKRDQQAADESAAGGGCSSSDTWTNYAQQFFAINCTRCHSPSGSQGTRIYDGTSYASVVGHVAKISRAIGSGRMPRDATLPAEDKARILAWLNCIPPPE